MKKIAVDGEKMALVLLSLFLLAIVILNGMVGDWGRLAGGPDNLVRFFFQSLWPPDMSVLEPQTYPVCTAQPIFDFTCSTAWKGVIETLKIAFVATVFGMIVRLYICRINAGQLIIFDIYRKKKLICWISVFF